MNLSHDASAQAPKSHVNRSLVETIRVDKFRCMLKAIEVKFPFHFWVSPAKKNCYEIVNWAVKVKCSLHFTFGMNRPTKQRRVCFTNQFSHTFSPAYVTNSNILHLAWTHRFDAWSFFLFSEKLQYFCLHKHFGVVYSFLSSESYHFRLHPIMMTIKLKKYKIWFITNHRCRLTANGIYILKARTNLEELKTLELFETDFFWMLGKF